MAAKDKKGALLSVFCIIAILASNCLADQMTLSTYVKFMSLSGGSGVMDACPSTAVYCGVTDWVFSSGGTSVFIASSGKLGYMSHIADTAVQSGSTDSDNSYRFAKWENEIPISISNDRARRHGEIWKFYPLVSGNGNELFTIPVAVGSNTYLLLGYYQGPNGMQYGVKYYQIFGAGFTTTFIGTPQHVCSSIINIKERSEVLVGCTSTIFRAVHTGTSQSMLSFSSVPVGAGVYTSLYYHHASGSVFAGSTIGLGLRLDIDTLSIRSILFIPSGAIRATITSIYVDHDKDSAEFPRIPVAYFGTNVGILVKAVATSLKILSAANTTALSAGKGTLSILGLQPQPGNSQNLMATLAVLRSSSLDMSESQWTSITRTNCGELSCTQCSEDPYCGWCYSTATCTKKASCSGTFGLHPTQCPVLSQLLTTSGSSNGGTEVVTTGNYFDQTNPALYYCEWTLNSVVKTTAATITATSATCLSPSYGGDQGTGTVGIKYGSVAWMPPQPFTFYHCESISNCYTCVSDVLKPECGWCISSSSCTSKNSCSSAELVEPSFAHGRLCPFAAATTQQPAISKTDTTPVTVIVYNFPATRMNYKCDFGSWGTTIATSTTTSSYFTSFSCPLPGIDTIISTTTITVQIEYNSKFVITNSGSELEVYDCPNLARCDQCTSSVHSACGWCGGSNPRCYYQSAGGCSEPMSTCPQIQSLSPNSTQEHTSKGMTVTLNGNGFSLASGATCLFTQGAVNLETPILGGSTSTQVLCGTPTSSQFGVGTWSVSLALSQVPEMNPKNFLVYNCATPTSCSSCALYETPDCLWCNSIGSLHCTNTTAGCSKPVDLIDSCPVIESSSPSVLLARNAMSVNISGDHLAVLQTEAASLRCGLALSSAPHTYLNTSSVTWVSDSKVTCDSLQSDVSGEHSVELYEISTSNLYSSYLPILATDCDNIYECDVCISSGCTFCGGRCADSCAEPSLLQTTCPVVTSVEPSYADLSGSTPIVIRGTNFLNPVITGLGGNTRRDFSETSATLEYTCRWGRAQQTPASITSGGDITCTPPPYAGALNVTLRVFLNSWYYFTAVQQFEIFTCTAEPSDACDTSCTAQSHCGFCVGSGNCMGQAACFADIWQPSCTSAALSRVTSSLDGGQTLSATLSNPLPSYTYAANLTCQFGQTITPATWETVNGISTVVCPIPPSPSPKGTVVPFSVQYSAKQVSARQNFAYVNCGQYTKCPQCGAQQNCGWCTIGNKCTLQADCDPARWSRQKCPLDALALGLGLGIGLFGLILIVLVILFLIRRASKRNGLVIQVREPDYDAIAWGNDINPLYRVPDDKWQNLNQILARRDYVLQLALALNCPATEQDSLAKGLVYVSCAHGTAPEMIKTVIRAEVLNCLEENTLFRSNSVASKMYKFYSRIVGIKYLYHCIARVVLELEVLGKQHEDNVKSGVKKDRDVSLLQVSMELDVEGGAVGDDIDTDTNLLQLQLICQKIINVLIKKSLNNIPTPLRQIFVEIDNSVTNKFPGSLEAVYKGLGGLFFLRFVCPAITAPHVYGLLPNPPNTTTQRQLVLITKVIQSIANMQAPGKKEQYMEVMGSFIENSIPRIRKFYDNLRMAANINSHTDIYEREIVVPDEVLMNGLAATQTILANEHKKLKTWAEKSFLDEMTQMELATVIDECISAHPNAPKKVKVTGTTNDKK